MGSLDSQLKSQPVRGFSGAQLSMIRRTVARACSDAEFDEFIAVAQHSGLDPLRRQIAPLIIHQEDPARRKLVPWATIDGLRLIAARQGDYRPMEAAPTIECADSAKDADRNPIGIVRAQVIAWKQSQGAWYPVAGEAWWDEYAPMREISEREVGDASTKKWVLEPTWSRMGRVMIAKCAEAQALRRGWPDVLSGLYGEDELHALRINEQTASDRLKARDEKRRLIEGASVLWFVFNPSDGPVAVPLDHASERVCTFVSAADREALVVFQRQNRLSLALLWEHDPARAFHWKEALDSGLFDVAAQPTRSNDGAVL